MKPIENRATYLAVPLLAALLALGLWILLNLGKEKEAPDRACNTSPCIEGMLE